LDNIKKKIEEIEEKENKSKYINFITEGKMILKKFERILKLRLWLAFLLNPVYEKNPNSNPTDEQVDDYDSNGKNEKNPNKNPTDEKVDEFTVVLYRLFNKYNEIMKAIEICKAPLEEAKNEHIEYISKADEFFYIYKFYKEENKRMELELKENDLNIKKKEFRNRKNGSEIKKRKYEEKINFQLEEIAKKMKIIENECNELKELNASLLKQNEKQN